jgi:hypothetical protein
VTPGPALSRARPGGPETVAPARDRTTARQLDDGSAKRVQRRNSRRRCGGVHVTGYRLNAGPVMGGGSRRQRVARHRASRSWRTMWRDRARRSWSVASDGDRSSPRRPRTATLPPRGSIPRSRMRRRARAQTCFVRWPCRPPLCPLSRRCRSGSERSEAYGAQSQVYHQFRLTRLVFAVPARGRMRAGAARCHSGRLGAVGHDICRRGREGDALGWMCRFSEADRFASSDRHGNADRPPVAGRSASDMQRPPYGGQATRPTHPSAVPPADRRPLGRCPRDAVARRAGVAGEKETTWPSL